MFRIKYLITLLICILIFTSFGSVAENVISAEDIKVIQNDSIVPRKALYQSKDAMNGINEATKIDANVLNPTNNDIKNPFIATRNLSFMILLLLLVFQVSLAAIGKITPHELLANMLKGLIMNLASVLGVYLIITITNSFGLFYNAIGQDFFGESIKNLTRFVISPDSPLSQGITKESIGSLNSVDYSQITLSPEGYCLKTIQDQYRVGLMILSWVYVVLVFLNWMLIIVSDVILTLGIIIAPIIGAVYVMGDKYQMINKYWSLIIEAAITKSIFFLVYGIVFMLTSTLTPMLTQTGVNIEFGLFSSMILIATFVSVIKIRSIVKADAAIAQINLRYNQLNNQIH
jgi:hypothetical protein